MNKTIGIISMLAMTATLATAGEIVGTITLKGTPPPEKEFDKNADKNCGEPLKGITHHYIVGSKGELANVTVSIQGMSGKSTGASQPGVVIDQKGCEYTPGIAAVQTGQKITFKNSDNTTHNMRTDAAEGSQNKPFSEIQPPGAPEKSYTPTKPETFLKFKCDVHPWMFAWVSVFDHPYFAVSGKDGTFKISNVPAGKYKLQAEHRKAGKTEKEIEVKEGEPTKVEFVLEAK
jgi:plastocyanin